MNKMNKIFGTLLAVALCFCFFAAVKPGLAYEAAEKHPIDIELEKKINADPSTYGMMQAYEQAVTEWDKLLNKNYQALMKKLDKKDQGKLRETQRAWIKYRDLEFSFNAEFWAKFEGTMYRVFPAAFQTIFVRERALQLGHYLEDSAAP